MSVDWSTLPSFTHKVSFRKHPILSPGWKVSKSSIHTLFYRLKMPISPHLAKKHHFLHFLHFFGKSSVKNEIFKYRKAIFYLVEIFMIFLVMASLELKHYTASLGGWWVSARFAPLSSLSSFSSSLAAIASSFYGLEKFYGHHPHCSNHSPTHHR